MGTALELLPAGPKAWELGGIRGAPLRLEEQGRTWLASGDGEPWRLMEVGLRRRLVVRPGAGLAEVAHVEPDWRSVETLRITGGPSFQLDRSSPSGLVVRDRLGARAARLTWSGHGARIAAADALLETPWARLVLAVAARLFLDDLRDYRRPLSFGEPARVRTRFA